jgi:hypothetical protein
MNTIGQNIGDAARSANQPADDEVVVEEEVVVDMNVPLASESGAEAVSVPHDPCGSCFVIKRSLREAQQ